MKTKIIILITIISITFNVSCSNKDSSSKPTPSNKKEPVTLTVEVYDRSVDGYKPDNNYFTKYIQENFGNKNNIQINYVPIPRWQDEQAINSLIASNNLPDIFFIYNQQLSSNYVQNNQVLDLTESLPKYAPNLKKYLTEEVLRYGQFDNKQYAIPAKRVLTAAQCTFIRNDWLNALGLSTPTTTEEFYNCIKLIKEKDPGNIGKKLTGYGISTIWIANLFLGSFIKNITLEDELCLPRWSQPGYKEGFRMLNKFYNEGLLNEFYYDKDMKQINKDASEGNLIAYSSGFSTLYKDYTPIDPFKNFEGKTPKVLYNQNGMNIFLSKTNQHVKESLEYLEWLSKPEVLKFLQNGTKGIHYLKEIDGVPSDIVSNNKLPNDKKIIPNDLAIISNGKEFFDIEKSVNLEAQNTNGLDELYKQAFKFAMKDGKNSLIFTKNITSESKYGKTLYDLENEIYTKIVISPQNEFDKTYDELVQNYLSSGGQEVIDEKRNLFKNGFYK